MKLEDACELIVDAEHKTAPFQKEGYPNIRTPNIGKGRLILEGVFRVSEETYRLWTKRAIPQANDLILAREAPVGNVAIVPENELVCLGQRTVLLRPDIQKINPQYLCYFLLGDEMQNSMLGKSGGSTVAHLNMKDIRA
ncbi:MAG: restriction endonuclease subunit S [Saprospiraceae bacterium]|nr:restriction endonuclease subunit S [Saprospiraceae bacterium]